MSEIQDVFDSIHKWSQTTLERIEVNSVFIFGSLINDDGKDFHLLNSDIDLVVVFSPGNDSLNNRLTLLEWLRGHVDDLERLIIKVLERDAQHPHVSIVCLTEIEAYHAIHKGGDNSLLCTPQFLKLESGSQLSDQQQSIAKGQDEPTFFVANADALSVIRNCQALRNKYLSNSFNNGYVGLREYSGPDVVPKPLMRSAAILGWKEFTDVSTKRTDLATGLKYIQEFLHNQVKLNDELIKKIDARVLRRGKPQPISSGEQLYISEILFDVAVQRLDSRRKQLDAIIQKQNS